MVSDRLGVSDSHAFFPRGHAHPELGDTFAYNRENSNRTNYHTLGEFS